MGKPTLSLGRVSGAGLSVLAAEGGKGGVFRFWNLTVPCGFLLSGPPPQTLENTPVLPLRGQRGPGAPFRHHLRACCWLRPACSVLCSSLHRCQAAAHHRAPHATRCWRQASQDGRGPRDCCCRSLASGSSSRNSSSSSRNSSSISRQPLGGGRDKSAGFGGPGDNSFLTAAPHSTGAGKPRTQEVWGEARTPVRQVRQRENIRL